MLENYIFKNYIIEKFQDPSEFFQWCLENNLYKSVKSRYFISRMKKFYEGEVEFHGLTCVLAFYNKKPVGIVLCEHQDYFENARLYEDLCRNKLKVKEEFDWGMQQVGMVSMYIKKSHRKKGLAKNMVLDLEKLRLSQIAREDFELHPLSVPLLQAKELAFDILLKNSQHCYITQYKPQDYLYPHNIHNLTYSLIEHREQEPYPLYEFHARLPFMQNEFNNVQIPYENSFNQENLEHELSKHIKTKKMKL